MKFKNKNKKKLYLGDLKYIKSYQSALKSKVSFFRALFKQNKIKKPYWFNVTRETNIKEIFENYRTRSNHPFFSKLNRSRSKRYKRRVLKYRLKPDVLFYNEFVKKPRKLLKPNYFDKSGRRFVGPRTQKHWWVDSHAYRTYKYLNFLRLKKNLVLNYGMEDMHWNPQEKQKYKLFLYLAKKLFKYQYGISQTQKLKTILKTIMKKKKDPNKLNLLFQHLESQLYIILIRMGLVHSLKESKYLIKLGLVFINGKRVTVPQYKLHPNDLVQIKFEDKSTLQPFITVKLNRLSKWASFRKKKQLKHVHVRYKELAGVFLEYPQSDDILNYLSNDSDNFHLLYSHVISNYKNL